MTREELITELNKLAVKAQEDNNLENYHREADTLLLDFINDDEVSEAYRNLPKWYA